MAATSTLGTVPLRVREGTTNRLLRAARDCRRAARRYESTSLAVAGRLLRLWVRDGFRPREALAAGLGDPRLPVERLPGCISWARLDRLLATVNHLRRDATQDKGAFYVYCQGLGVPVPRLWAIFEKGLGFSGEGRVLTRRADWEVFFEKELPEEFVVKPVNGSYGRGFNAFQRCPGGFVDAGGVSYTPANLYDTLAGHHHYRRFIIQQRLRNHARLRELSGTESLQTLRINTFVEEDGTSRAYCPEVKLITGDSLVDNYHHGRTGNIVALVGRGGVLGPGLAPSPDGIDLVEVTHHPRTGAALASHPLPFFAETVALVERIAPLFLPIRAIGWDVAPTVDGPVVVEGNMFFDPPTLVRSPFEPLEASRTCEALLTRLRDYGKNGRPPITRPRS
jgi:hypothetical protein